MTTEPEVAPSKPTDNEVLGAILSGMIAFDQGITNSLIDSHIDSAIDWAKRFQSLYRRVQKHNRDTLVQDVLDDNFFAYDDSFRAIEHLESMKMKEVQP